MGATATETKDRIKDYKSAIAAKVARNDEITSAISGDGSTEHPLVLEEGMVTEFRANLSDIKGARASLDLLLANEDARAEVKRLEQPTSDPVSLKAAFSGALSEQFGRQGERAKSLGQRFVESDEFKDMVTSGRLTMDRPFGVTGDLGSFWSGISTKDIYSDLPTGTPGRFGTIERDPMVSMPNRRERVRDLFPARPTMASIIEYIRVSGFTNAASTVAERTGNAFTAKPQSGLSFVGEQAPLRIIAHWEAIHRNTLADEPQLRDLVNNELLYGLRLREDAQILNGLGTGEDMLGILNTTGIQNHVQSSVAGDTKADALRRAATLVSLAEYEPTGVVVHDSDWEDIELLKDSTGSYILAVNVAVGAQQRVWRMPVVQTPAIASGTGLVAAFGLAVKFYIREEGNIRVSEHHEDFFVRNAAVVLAEERAAVATKRPQGIVEVTFT